MLLVFPLFPGYSSLPPFFLHIHLIPIPSLASSQLPTLPQSQLSPRRPPIHHHVLVAAPRVLPPRRLRQSAGDVRH